LKHLSPVLWTKNLQQTIEFYTVVLGFSARSNFPDFVALCQGDAEIMFVVPKNDREDCGPGNKEEFFPQPRLTGSIYIFMENVDAFWETIKDKVTVAAPIANREYQMRDFSIRDNNGYELVFGEDISQTK
jgi:catechol 2,3-dioxygenase-like lactoylglutathione lyase family enzyme